MAEPTLLTADEALAAVLDALHAPHDTPWGELPALVALRCRPMDRQRLDRLVAGGLKCAIDTHGPISHEQRVSAAKRIAGQIHAVLRAQHLGLEDPGQGVPRTRRERTSHPLGDVGSACRVCGCTEDRACPGGCWWVEPDLCSACAETAA
ncbi:MAG: hypothetical protein WC326_08380 [Candidatus Delongbacteria bacterium]